MEVWGMHFVTFLAGVFSGAGGKYLADKYTDQRRNGEKQKTEKKEIIKIKKLMPELLAEMRDDFHDQDSLTVRELVILPSKNVMFNSGAKRFIYFETEHEDLKGKISILENHGYITDVTPVNVPIFRISEAFWESIRKMK